MWKGWTAGWVGVCGLAMVNGAVRDALYTRHLGQRTAHQLSTGTLLAAIGGCAWALHRRQPLPDARTALAVGGMWTGLTLAFEFGFGHWVGRQSWAELTGAYDMTSGDLWVLVPAGTLLAPEVVRRLQKR